METFSKSRLTLQLQQKRQLLIETDLAAVIKDAYPKAQYHFLVLPKEDISNVCGLRREHLPLLDHMKELANQIIEQQHHLPSSNFLIGFKIDAYMNRLNMHVISNDFYSESMRKKKHWNSFNTGLFLSYQAVYALLRVRSCVEPMPAEEVQQLREAQHLRCNQCDFECDSILELKMHLCQHWQKREAKFETAKQVEKVIRMLDESKLMPSKQPCKESQKVDEKSESKRVNWRQNRNQQSNNTNKEASKTSETQQHPQASNPNAFQKHYQKTACIAGATAQQQQRQPAVMNFNHNFQQGSFGPRPRFAQQQQPRANYQPRGNYQNMGFNPQYFNSATNNNIIPTSAHSQQTNHFNPFRQIPSMDQVGSPIRYQGPRCPLNQNQRQNNFQPINPNRSFRNQFNWNTQANQNMNHGEPQRDIKNNKSIHKKPHVPPQQPPDNAPNQKQDGSNKPFTKIKTKKPMQHPHNQQSIKF